MNRELIIRDNGTFLREIQEVPVTDTNDFLDLLPSNSDQATIIDSRFPFEYERITEEDKTITRQHTYDTLLAMDHTNTYIYFVTPYIYLSGWWTPDEEGKYLRMIPGEHHTAPSVTQNYIWEKKRIPMKVMHCLAINREQFAHVIKLDGNFGEDDEDAPDYPFQMYSFTSSWLQTGSLCLPVDTGSTEFRQLIRPRRYPDPNIGGDGSVCVGKVEYPFWGTGYLQYAMEMFRDCFSKHNNADLRGSDDYSYYRWDSTRDRLLPPTQANIAQMEVLSNVATNVLSTDILYKTIFRLGS